jgi:hypothetical protein
MPTAPPVIQLLSSVTRELTGRSDSCGEEELRVRPTLPYLDARRPGAGSKVDSAFTNLSQISNRERSSSVSTGRPLGTDRRTRLRGFSGPTLVTAPFIQSAVSTSSSGHNALCVAHVKHSIRKVSCKVGLLKCQLRSFQRPRGHA